MGLLFDRNLDNGQGQVPETNIPLDGSQVHITQYQTDGTRWSWEANGQQLDAALNQHFTNSNVPPGDPRRHAP